MCKQALSGIGAIIANKLNCEQNLERFNNGKSYRSVSNVIRCSKYAAFDCKNLKETRYVDNLQKSASERPIILVKPRAKHFVCACAHY